MKLRLKLEEFFEDRTRCCMQKFKQNTEFENAELTRTVFFKTEIEKKVVKVTDARGEFFFEEWEPRVFEKTFEIL